MILFNRQCSEKYDSEKKYFLFLGDKLFWYFRVTAIVYRFSYCMSCVNQFDVTNPENQNKKSNTNV